VATSASWPADTIAGRVGDARAVVLVEGRSDQFALERLAERRGRNLAAERILVVPTGGATSIGPFVHALGPRGTGVRLAGLCDAGEEPYIRRSLERAGVGSDLDRAEMEALGFFVCVADLEQELIRALGVEAVIGVLAADGELGPFRTFQRQPAQRERSTDAQLRRFMGTRAGRKHRYAVLLVDALDLARAPRPLDGVLASV
jgi:hypothetical protein